MPLPQRVFDIHDFGAVGNGTHDDWAAIQATIEAAIKHNGCVYVPPGRYLSRFTFDFEKLKCRISFRGDGANVSQIVFMDCREGLNLRFEQEGAAQCFGVSIADLGFVARGYCGTALTLSYGDPIATSDHYQPSIVIRGVNIVSDNNGNTWDNGIRIGSAWNVSMTDVFISGDSAHGVWNRLHGHGIHFERMCVNAHLENVRCNFWAVGLLYTRPEKANTEGIFCSNCSMVAVKRGVWIMGNPDAAAPRVSTLTWIGGMIECRVGGVDTGSAAFHLVNVWTALISGCQMLAETLDVDGVTYGLFLDNCAGIVVTACDINAWKIGLATTGRCTAINSNGNAYTNCELQNCFTTGTTGSRSFGHTYYNNAPHDEDQSGENKMGFVN